VAFAATHGNVGYMGLPLTAQLGDPALMPAMVMALLVDILLVIVITILLNLIFGIIIDTFSQYGLTHPYLALHGLASLRLAPPCQLPTRPPARPFATCLHRHRLRTEKAEDYM
jgi:hypothetical protein